MHLVSTALFAVSCHAALLRLVIWGMTKYLANGTGEKSDTLFLGCLLRNTGAGLVITSSAFPHVPGLGITLAMYAFIQHVALLAETMFRTHRIKNDGLSQEKVNENVLQSNAESQLHPSAAEVIALKVT